MTLGREEDHIQGFPPPLKFLKNSVGKALIKLIPISCFFPVGGCKSTPVFLLSIASEKLLMNQPNFYILLNSFTCLQVTSELIGFMKTHAVAEHTV